MTIEGERVRLRPLRRDDAQGYFQMASDPRVTRYLNHAPYTEPRQAEERIAHLLEAAEGFVWAIAPREDDAFVGTVSLFHFVREHRRCELGYDLMSAAQGKGYAREAVRLALVFAFEHEGMWRVEADIDPRNAPSRKLVEKLGFTLEGTLRQRWHVNGEICDTSLYGLLKGELT